MPRASCSSVLSSYAFSGRESLALPIGFDHFQAHQRPSLALQRAKTTAVFPLPSSLTAHLFTQSHEATKTKGEHLWRTNHLHAHCTTTIEFIASIVRKRDVGVELPTLALVVVPFVAHTYAAENLTQNFSRAILFETLFCQSVALLYIHSQILVR